MHGRTVKCYLRFSFDLGRFLDGQKVFHITFKHHNRQKSWHAYMRVHSCIHTSIHIIVAWLTHYNHFIINTESRQFL